MSKNIISVKNLSKSFDISSKKPGLKATITVVDYDYKITTANHESTDTSADSGTMTQLTIGASF